MQRPQPHDLIWLRDPAAIAVAAPVPDWADAEWLAQAPVVVRRDRDCSGSGRIPVGLRGRQRAERHAAWIDTDQCASLISPFDIAGQGYWRMHPRRDAIPALNALDHIAAQLGKLQFQWGVTGAVGFTLASGIDVLHAGSDIDLLIAAPQALPMTALDELGTMLDTSGVRLDVQIATPAGAFALLERLRTRGRVLLKTDSGPVLCDDPWQPTWPRC
ncbi:MULTISPECIES: malonate decarboxylase holo-ACP synthase [Cupriavidus]|uniref:Malonate decarboxylase holo-ACP synthase n=1 Tax=Cupriavidus metallidurans TaxID=119219 RepID=A0A482J003_9BURK|nr:MULTISPECIES: malonate decarboxylase holo-ACP synthase [Cupriavidus]MWL91924.1 malonate decarboxylase holo-ACP synthase [Cupriavidus sp. SW-Y-13]QBP14565.1 malonate decarboxylase holo-ACP synthase [Cupriavidus metallidurans]